jgi:hypothetical protein
MLVGELQYPYVRIDSIDEDEKIVSFFYDDETIYKRNYRRNDSWWVSFQKAHDPKEGATYHFYEYISEDKIIELEYNGDPLQDSSLVKLTISQKI